MYSSSWYIRQSVRFLSKWPTIHPIMMLSISTFSGTSSFNISFFLLWPSDHMVYHPWVVETYWTWHIPSGISPSPESCWLLWHQGMTMYRTSIVPDWTKPNLALPALSSNPRNERQHKSYNNWWFLALQPLMRIWKMYIFPYFEHVWPYWNVRPF